jgi:ABC-2 type transport system permease protein
MSLLCAVFRREFQSYFATPLAFVFLVIFLFAMGVFTFYVGHFFDNGIADLSVFFGYHPWLYLFLIPALAMRLWAEERRSGTIELLLTLPVPTWTAVLGKFLAAWAFAGIALALTFPIWITVNVLGHPDNGVILASYAGSLLMAGAYLSIGAAVSAATGNPVIAFIVAVTLSFLMTVTGSPLVLDAVQGWAPLGLVEAVSSISIVSHFAAITRGVLALPDLVYFASLIGLFLFANLLIVNLRKAG